MDLVNQFFDDMSQDNNLLLNDLLFLKWNMIHLDNKFMNLADNLTDLFDNHNSSFSEDFDDVFNFLCDLLLVNSGVRSEFDVVDCVSNSNNLSSDLSDDSL